MKIYIKKNLNNVKLITYKLFNPIIIFTKKKLLRKKFLIKYFLYNR